ncbi:zinc-dependent alcohol dehydrogenase [Arsenicicoccus sp. oral taxon 190]|uniref:zinc-dependent alcohol dehydrogenase n=1 Tax=Arsenicicoccus sp. oral taxon 190 TaxID=1658671 RepID=UPI00067A409B|nr:zinc-dependent alcohol dehydrogenase [Arsenicicoccus sp. oral taxon 190]AKT50315.1 molecular chaperone GroES [Arsenicicoccus sp. oral taxon 190]
MKALTWQGVEKVAVEQVPDPRIEQPTDAIVRVTSTAICGSDLHLYKTLAPFLTPGDVLGHEFMGIVEEVGAQTGDLKVGDRVVVPFNISCGHCAMCRIGKQSQCETTQVRDQGMGAALFGYTSLYGAVPGGQAEYVRVPQAQYGPVVLPTDGPDERYLYLSDILPTAWQAAKYADIEPDSTVAVYGLGPVGQFAARSALQLGAGRVIGVDRVDERLELAKVYGVETVDLRTVSDPAEAIKELTGGRGADSVIEAVGMEAHGSPVAGAAVRVVGKLPRPLGRAMTERMGIDQLSALHSCFDAVRRGGTVSVVGVYGGAVDPMPMMTMFDKNLTIRMGQANVRRWTDEIFEVLQRDGDVLGTETLATHRVSLDDAPRMYDTFQKKQDGCIKVVMTP